MGSTVLAGCLLAGMISAVYGQGKYPCHGEKDILGAHSCSGVTLPYRLCSACSLKPVAPNGDFVQCNNIYALDNQQCKTELERYVEMNPCDDKRKDQLMGWSSWDIQNLDYFVYSVCEHCCDCIPKGTKEWQFESLSQSHTDEIPSLYKPDRGNCPAHAFYDICKLYPNVKYMRTPWGPKHEDWPEACPILDQWFYSGASSNWANSVTSLNFEAKRFLNNVNVANQCKNEEVWKSCRNMEAAQGRV